MNIDTQRIQMVLPKAQYERVTEDEGIGYIVDVHEFHRTETKRMINNMINVVRNPCRITVIHGYNRGTVLLRMIRTELNNPKIKRILTVAYNPGETLLEIA